MRRLHWRRVRAACCFWSRQHVLCCDPSSSSADLAAWVRSFCLPGALDFQHLHSDGAAAQILYLPRAGETLATVEATATTSVMEVLLNVSGTKDAEFESISYQHSTWLGAARVHLLQRRHGAAGGVEDYAPRYETHDCSDDTSCKYSTTASYVKGSAIGQAYARAALG